MKFKSCQFCTKSLGFVEDEDDEPGMCKDCASIGEIGRGEEWTESIKQNNAMKVHDVNYHCRMCRQVTEECVCVRLPVSLCTGCVLLPGTICCVSYAEAKELQEMETKGAPAEEMKTLFIEYKAKWRDIKCPHCSAAIRSCPCPNSPKALRVIQDRINYSKYFATVVEY